MTVAAPPRPPHADPEALIEEARRRTRRRRLIYAAAVTGIATLGGAAYGIYTAVAGSSGPAVPPGFELVHAKGAVSHAVIEVRGPRPTVVVDPDSGAARPAKVIWEAWFDRKGGLERVRDTIAGRQQFDVSGRTQCFKAGSHGFTKSFCLPPGSPFDLPNRGFTWPLKSSVRELGHAKFRGRSVIWVAQLTNGRLQRDADRVALDAKTHRLVAYRQLADGHVFYEQVYTSFNTVAGADVDFVVPKRAEPSHSWPPGGTGGFIATRRGPPAASAALGGAPLWLGRSFHGHEVGQVRVNVQQVGAAKVSMVTLDYGAVSLIELRRSETPTNAPFTGNPPPGRILLNSGSATYVKDGVVVQAASVATPRSAAELMTSLRPMRR